ncbi:MAG: hypothetical protein C0522_05550 [Rhodocyclaceae bacterium]|jgi:3-oxoadipate enol-lactonase|nr:hypothetical protein [Rhodocyclaceae bacterium]
MKINANGIMINYEITGSGPWLTLSHSLCCDGSMWAPQRLDRLVLADTTSRMPPEAQPLWAERIRIATEEGVAPLVQPTLERWFTASYRTAHPEVMAQIGGLIRGTPPAGYAGCAHAISRLDVTKVN